MSALLINLIDEGVCFISGGGIAFALAKRWYSSKNPKPIQAICSCGHVLSYHDPRSGRCQYSEIVYNTETEVVRDVKGNPVPNEWGNVQTTKSRRMAGEVSCPCQRYVGPELLTSYFLPEISDETTTPMED